MKPEPGASAQVTVAGDRVIVMAFGEFDLATAGVLADALTEACATRLPVTVNLSGVAFMDASALRVIVASAKALSEDGCELTVVRPSGCVERLFTLTGLQGLLAADCDEEAV